MVFDGCLDVADEFVDVGGGGVVGVDDEAAVFLAHLGAADSVTAQAGVHDELTGKVALGALEGGAGARHVERLLVLAALAVVIHVGLDHRGVARGEVKGGREHDKTVVGDAALAIAQVELVDIELNDIAAAAGAVVELASGFVDAHGLQHIGHAGAVSSGVHVAGAADRSGDARDGLHAGKAGLGCRRGDIGKQGTGCRRDMRAVDRNVGEAFAQRHDDAADALVADEQVGAVAHDGEGQIAAIAGIERGDEALLGIGRDKDVGRAADLKRGVLAHGLAHQHVVLAGNASKRAQQVLVKKVVLVHTNIRLLVVVVINRLQYTPPGRIWCAGGDKTAVYRIGKVFIIKVEGRSLYFQEIARILGRSEMGNKVTLKQIAQEVGLSPSSVSLVLNNRPCRISEENRKLIKEVAARNHYVPNQIARSLVMRESRTLGLIVPNIESRFFASLAGSLEKRCREDGYALFITSSGGSAEDDLELLRQLVTRGVDGVFLVVGDEFSDDRALREEVSHLPIPAVMVDRAIEGLECDKVMFDHEMGGYMATRYLIEQGHRRIACLVNARRSNTGRKRLAGYERALREVGLPIDARLEFESEYYIPSAYEASEAVLATDATAVFASSDNIALGLLKRLHEMGKSIPGDISVVSYDNSAADVLFEPALTAIEQDPGVLAEHAFGCMSKRLAGRGGRRAEEVVLEPALIVKGSVLDLTEYS